MKARLPSDALKRISPLHAIALAVAAVVVVAGISVGGVALGSALRPGLTHPTASPVALNVPGDDAAPVAASPNQVEGSQEVAEAQVAAAKAAADLLAQQQAQAAADAAAKAAVQKKAAASAPIKCPAGSQANSGDGGNDTSCFPEICFHITLPDPAHPECVTAFKP